MKALDKIYISSVFGLSGALAQTSQSIKDSLVLEIQATGYEFDIEPSKLADYIISECDNFNFTHQTEFTYADFLNTYVSQQPQHKEAMKRQFLGLMRGDILETGRDFGNSANQYTIKATYFNYEAQKAKYNDNQKWYNQFQNKRKRK
jgi:hypothetical protein